MTTAIASVADATIVTALALLVCAALRRAPAALRHMILAASLGVAALAPVLEAILPQWEIALLSSAATGTGAEVAFSADIAQEVVATPTAEPVVPGLSWTAVLVTAWAIGFVAVLMPLFVGLVRLVSMTRRCRDLSSRAWRDCADALSQQHGLNRRVVVLESPDRALLLTWGHFRPRVIVPAGAGSWVGERIEVVLAHEIAHIARRDWAVQIAAETVRAAYWFNPLVWIACRRLRDESEQACDDIVLRRGIRAADYASHLLAIARHLLTFGPGWISAPAAANASTLERRIAAMLNASRNRAPLPRTTGAVVLFALLAITIPVAAATLTEQVAPTAIAPAVLHDVVLSAPLPVPATTPPAAPARPSRRAAPRAVAASPAAAAPAPQQKPATLSGVLRDASGAVLPGVMVTVTDTPANASYSATTDASGRFAFKNLTPTTYQLTARLPGFATIAQAITLASGENVQRDLVMRIGTLMETVVVTCPAGAAGAPGRSFTVGTTFAFARRPAARLFAQQGVPVRVGGNLQAAGQTRKVQPVCPGSPVPANGFVVILEMTVGADGLVKDVAALRPRSGEQDAFVQAAMDAVRQWEYTPVRLNGVPTAVIATVTVTFTRP